MRSVVSALVTGICLCSAASAEPIDDARAIVNMTIDESQFQIMFDSIGDLMLGTLQNELAKEGETLSDDAGRVYVAMLTGHMVNGLSGKMQEPLAEAYVLNLSPETLTAYRAFLETEAGQEVAATQGIIMQESTKIGEQLAAPVATEAVMAAQADMENGNWPKGTLKSTQKELMDLMGLPPVSEDPPAR